MRMMSGMLQDKNVEHLVSTVEVFIGSLSSLMAVFDGYDGGDFCAGFIFGMNGATMLTQIASTAFEMFGQPPKGNKVSHGKNDNPSFHF